MRFTKSERGASQSAQSKAQAAGIRECEPLAEGAIRCWLGPNAVAIFKRDSPPPTISEPATRPGMVSINFQGPHRFV